MKAQQTPIPMPIREIGRSRAATGPGTITTATPNNPALIAIGPATISRAGQLSVSDATESAAAVHASDAPATMYPAVSGLSACNRCRNSGAYIASGLYAIDSNQTIHSPAPVADRREKASLGRSATVALRSIRSIRTNVPIAATINALLIAGPTKTLASDSRAIPAHIKATRRAGTLGSVTSSLAASTGRINNAVTPSRPATPVIA